MMTSAPTVSGRDVDPQVLHSYRSALNSVGQVREWKLHGFDRTGVPVAATVWTGNDDRPGEAHGVGYGSSWSAASVGALGEVAERVVTAEALRTLPLVTMSYEKMLAAKGVGGVADPLTLALPAGSHYRADQPVTWVPATRWRTGEEVWVPVEFIANDPSGLPPSVSTPLITPITNGLGAGDTVERAVGHALLELVQRDGDTVSFRAMDQGMVIDLNSLTDATAMEVVGRLRRAGVDPVVKLASTEFACVVYAMGRDSSENPPPLALTAIGEASHPDGQTAIASALLEFASSRARRAFAFGPMDDVKKLLPDYYRMEMTFPVGPQEPRALQDMQQWATMTTAQQRQLAEPMLGHEVRRLHVSTLPSHPPLDPETLLATMLERLRAFDVLTVVGCVGGIFAAKVIVPGLEVETMSYLRIGQRVLQRLLDRGSPLVGRGAPTRADQLEVRLTDSAIAELGGPAWLDRSLVEAVVGQLYPLYREPRRHAVGRIGRSSS